VLADLSGEFGPRSTAVLAPEVSPARH
jgi:hypothetical protein